MLHKILVIDDHFDERSEIYRRLPSACRDIKFPTPHGFEVELIFARHPWEVDVLLKQHAFSAIILDVVLSAWKWRSGEVVRANEMLSKFDDGIPVALLSSEWLSDEVRNIVSDWPTKNCRMFIHWEDLSNDARVNTEGSLTRIICEFAGYIEAYKSLDYSISLSEHEPIRILHLSDLQFGGFNQWKLKLEASHCATTIRKKWRNGPTFIVITGDISERGLPEEYDAAYSWLSKLASEFGWTLPTSRILIVPGNHDICLPLASSVNLALQETDDSKRQRSTQQDATKIYRVEFNDGIEQNSLSDFALRPFLDFCSKVAPRPFISPSDDHERRKSTRHSCAWVEGRFRHIGIVFFGLNTAQPIHARSVPDRRIPLSTIEEIVKEIQLLSENISKPPLAIGLTHHYPLRGQEGWAVDEPDHFVRLLNDAPRVGLWLHGHWHQRETTYLNHLVINSAPSLTIRESARPPDSARGFSLIEILRDEDDISGCDITPVDWVGPTGLKIRDAEGEKYSTGKDGLFKSTRD